MSDLDDIRQRHTSGWVNAGMYADAPPPDERCITCSTPWPCDAARLLDQLAISEAEVARRVGEGWEDFKKIKQLGERLARAEKVVWRSVYPTTEGYWWHKGPFGTCLHKMRMAPIGYPEGLWPHDADTNAGLWNIDGEWAGPLEPPTTRERT